MTKVMFLSAVLRPRYDVDGNCVFYEKLGIWPFVETVLAKRSLRRRPAGTPDLKGVNVDKATYKQYAICHSIPSIIEKWPGCRSWTV